MKKTTNIKFLLGLALLAFATMIAPAQASRNIDLSNPAFATVSGQTSIPIGHAQFCQTRPQECQAYASVTEAVTLTQERWDELLDVNARFNQSIVAVTDQDLYQTEEFWTYPRGYGDCEDFVLAKRRDLIERGWPASTLLISVVRQTTGDGHAVLLVRTDRGDLVLDNLRPLVKIWNQTPYEYIKRQSQSHAGIWVDMVDNRPMSVLASL